MASNKDLTVCLACGWTPYKQRCCDYESNVKLFYGAGTRGAWFIGTNFVLKERPADPPTYEVVNIPFLLAHTSIPIPTIAKDWVDKNGCQFIMVDRIEGETLEAAWPTLSSDAKNRIAEQTANCLQHLRNLQSDKMAGIEDTPLYDGFLFLQGQTPHGPFASDDEFWECMMRKLEKLPQKARDALCKQLPSCAPYTFTNGDLTNVNIMVKDGNLASIVDWDRAGYYPVWWEYASAAIGYSKEDAEWKRLLRGKMQPFKDGEAFWNKFSNLSNYPNLDDHGKKILGELLRE